MPRPTNTEERRAQIAGALLQVMAKRGFEGASIAGIAKAAHLTQGLVHYHFRDKQEILLVALRRLVARHDAGLAERMAGVAGDPAGEVGAFIDFHLGLGADADPEALACWILLGGEALRQPKVRAGYRQAIAGAAGRLAEAIRRGMSRGTFRCARAEEAASGILAAVQGYFVLAATVRSAIPKGSAARSAKQMAYGLLRSEVPPGRCLREGKVGRV
jgi:TetR/AcrR family transcriptional repressor of bet genes